MGGNGSRDQDRRWRRPQSGSVDDLGGFAGLSACPIHAWRDERARRPNAKRPVTAAPGWPTWLGRPRRASREEVHMVQAGLEVNASGCAKLEEDSH